jgi:TonB family protein
MIMEKYFLIATISSIVFYAIYYLFLRKESFHQFNRCYLLSTLMLSLVIPFIRFSVPVPAMMPVSAVSEPTVSNFTEIITYIQLPEFTVFANSPTTSWWSVSNLFLSIYFLGVIVLSILFIIKLVKIASLIIQSSKNRKGKYIYVKYAENIAPFSFFNYIFINADAYNEEDTERIMLHEQIHVRQRHSWDLIFVELVSILLWFNPILIFYKRSLQVIHEYLADHRVLQHGFEQGAYLNLLLRQITLQNINVGALRATPLLGHHFNYLLTKNRFKMLKNNHYSKWALAKFALALPFIALLLMLNCKNKPQTVEEVIPETVVFELNEGIPVVTEMLPEPENEKDIIADAEKMKKNQTVLLQLVEEGKMWNSPAFIEELKSEFVYFLDGQYFYTINSNKPDFVEIKCAKHDKLIYEAQRDESGKIYVIEVATGERDPDYLKVSKEDADTPPLRIVEVMPEPIGGFDAMYEFLRSNLKFPDVARKEGIAGQVFLEFVIEKDGSVSNVKVLSGVHPDLDAESVRVIKMMPKWKPGMQKGKPVRTFFQIPVRFTIN